MATADDLFARLRALGIETATVDHAPVFTVEEARRLRGQIPGGHSKNLFFKDRKDALWLLVCLEDAEVDLKSLHAKMGAARLSFGKPELLREVLGVEPGSVTPFAVINDGEGRVTVVLDEALLAHETLNFHPLVNSRTTSIGSADLIRFLEASGHSPRRISLA
jgi:Ala-tRNA(Pro) deacylase